MLPQLPFNFKKTYGLSVSHGVVFTADSLLPDGRIVVIWKSAFDRETENKIPYNWKDVDQFIKSGSWIVEAPVEEPVVEQPVGLTFDGSTFVQARDGIRLTGQYLRVSKLMNDGQWRSLSDIAKVTGDPEASVSARLRDLRKEKFGAHTVERRHVEGGLFEYRLAA